MSTTIETRPEIPAFDYFSVELTNGCNLACVHCYSSSSPATFGNDRLGRDKYLELIREARALRCRAVSFIGGEPTANRDLPYFLEEACRAGFELVELYSNLYDVPERVFQAVQDPRVVVATSLYSHDAATHDAITTRPGSHRRTVANIRRLRAAGVRLRVSIVNMAQNEGHLEATRAFATDDLGVAEIAVDRLREFGRAGEGEATESLANLCGSCAESTLCVQPDGTVSPCNISRQWHVGSVLDSTLEEVLTSPELRRLREAIGVATKDNVVNCVPMGPCLPCTPNGGPYCDPRRAEI